MKRRLKSLLPAAAAVLLIVAGGLVWRLWPRERELYTDADTIRTPRDGTAIREVLWQPPQRLSEILDAGPGDHAPVFSADGRMLFFVRGRPGENADIYVRLRTGRGWGEATPLARVNTEFDELGPELSADGQTLYFYSNRLGNVGGYDLWVSRRDATGWAPAVNLGGGVNTPFNECAPAISTDGRTLFFSSNRPNRDRPEVPEPKEESAPEDYDLYACALTGDHLGPVTALRALNTPSDEATPALSPIGDFLYFASNRSGGSGGFDLYRARRVGDRFRPPESLGGIVNTAANELEPKLGLGGYALYFSSDREQREGTGESGRYVGFHTASREVFRDVETFRPTIDWAELWRAAGPSALWALLALLLILLCLALFRDYRERRLSLLARCLLASVLVHLVLMLLLNVVHVTTRIADVMRRGKVRVSLLAATGQGELAVQLRGRLTEIETPAARRLPTPAPHPPEAKRRAPAFVRLAVLETTPTWREQPGVRPEGRDAPAPTVKPTPTVTRERAVEAGAVATLQLATPAVPSPVKIAEAGDAVKPVADRPRALRAGSLATTRPAIEAPSIALAPGPARQALARPRPLRADFAAAAREAAPPPIATPAVAYSLRSAEGPVATRLALRTPENQSSRWHRRESSPPVVAAAQTSVPRASGTVAPRRVDADEAKPRILALAPEATSGDWRGVGVVNRSAEPPQDAMPAPRRPKPSFATPVSTASTNLDDVALPEVHERVAQAEGAPSPWVGPGASGLKQTKARAAVDVVLSIDAPEYRSMPPVSADAVREEESLAREDTPRAAAPPLAARAAARALNAERRAPPPLVGLALPADHGEDVAVVEGDRETKRTAVSAPRPDRAPFATYGAGKWEPRTRRFVALTPAPATEAVNDDRRLLPGEARPPAAAPEAVAVVSAPPRRGAITVPLRAGIALPPTPENKRDGAVASSSSASEPETRVTDAATLQPPRAAAALPANEEASPLRLTRLLPSKRAAFAPRPQRLANVNPEPAEAVIAETAEQAMLARPRLAARSGLPPVTLALPDTHGEALPDDTIGVIRGRIRDADTEAPLAGASVRLVLPDAGTIRVVTDETGHYVLYVPPVPDFFALSASLRGYIPGTVTIPAAQISRQAMEVNFDLQAQSEWVIAIEAEPDVHHLGNDRFEGRINSRFQRRSEGRVYRQTFEVTRDQLSVRYDHAEVSLLARGVQCPHEIRINRHRVRTRLARSPRDGQFGRFVARFDPEWLEVGRNRLKITAKSCRGDLDDFEFVNVQIRLVP
ncbi:MAG: carboxypeptidase regulatory-like domain-containing protein [Phycisphaerae bacterium]